jgi:hypothetical protein
MTGEAVEPIVILNPAIDGVAEAERVRPIHKGVDARDGPPVGGNPSISRASAGMVSPS